MKWKVLICVLMLVSISIFSGCLGEERDEGVIPIEMNDGEMFFSDDFETILLYVGHLNPNKLVEIIDTFIDDGYEYIGSYTTKLSWSQYANEAYLLFRLVDQG